MNKWHGLRSSNLFFLISLLIATLESLLCLCACHCLLHAEFMVHEYLAYCVMLLRVLHKMCASCTLLFNPPLKSLTGFCGLLYFSQVRGQSPTPPVRGGVNSHFRNNSWTVY